MPNLYEKIDSLKEAVPNEYKVLPDLITNNLKFSEIREYQKTAFRNYITYFENSNLKKPNTPSRVLFHSATGSGKTLIMAGLILYLYKKGYRDFVFFVDKTNIIDKTKSNFLDPTSSKYLFKDTINIDGKRVEFNEIDNFNQSQSDKINIMFMTTSALHYNLNHIRENSITHSDFTERKVVFIADEAHHLNADTKKKITKDEEENKRSWEATIKGEGGIFHANNDNILLEFTATCNLENENIKTEYNDKIIFNYPLKQFRIDRFSKEVLTFQTDLTILDKALLALIISQYRLKIFQDNKIQVKPCILFKSREIKESFKNREDFISMINTLTGEKIKKLFDIVDDKEDIIKNIKKYLEVKNISFPNLVLELKEAFGENHIISANSDDDVENKQLALNTLEDLKNPYRAIFAVNKLDEGWDVLNLFDIVRLYETGRTGGKTSSTVTSEAQLIGRGARYYPFLVDGIEKSEKYKRKFDNDLKNPLRTCETLLYHCQNDSKYISELHKELVNTGIKEESKQEITYKLKESFKQSDCYNYGKIYVNDRIIDKRGDVNEIDPQIRSDTNYSIKLDMGNIVVQKIMEENIDSESENEDTNVKKKRIYMRDIFSINPNIIYSALRKFQSLEFANLKRKYPSLKSIKEFVTSPSYMNDMSVEVKYSDNVSQINILNAVALKIAIILDKYISNIKERYKGTYEFKSIDIKRAFSNKTLKLTEVIEEGLGEAQSSGGKYQMNLKNMDWFAYDENYGTSEEKSFVKYISEFIPNYQKIYKQVYLIRNERQIHLYSFDEGQRFEPDYILLLYREKNNLKNKINFGKTGLLGIDEQLQIFIEPKGGNLLKYDKWKEKFLLQLQKLNQGILKVQNKTISSVEGIWGIHFYNEENNNKDSLFKNDLEELETGVIKL